MTKYSVEEIDAMRRLVREHMGWSQAVWIEGTNRYDWPRDTNDEVETRLRTLMLNGTTVDEMKEAVLAARAKFMAEKPK